jgi:hypothetical protein
LHDGVGSETQVAASRKIENRSRDGRDGQTLVFDDVTAVENRPVDRDPRRRTATEPSMRRNRELDLRRVRVGKAKNRKGCLMGKGHARASMRLGPENRFTIRGEGIAMRMNESIDTTRKTLQPTAFDHTSQGSPADAGFGRGASGHETFVLGCEL